MRGVQLAYASITRRSTRLHRLVSGLPAYTDNGCGYYLIRFPGLLRERSPGEGMLAPSHPVFGQSPVRLAPKVSSCTNSYFLGIFYPIDDHMGLCLITRIYQHFMN